MKKISSKKLGIGGLMLIAGLGLNSCNGKYMIDGYETKYHPTANTIIIQKEKDKIIYNGALVEFRVKKNLNNDSLLYVQVNSDRYFFDDTLVYPAAAEMFKYLKQEIRKQKQEQGLNALERNTGGEVK